jgi:hypothetical protein
MRTDRCPYRKAGFEGRAVYYSNAIVRPLQKQDVKTSGRQVNAIRVVKLPPGLYEQIDNYSFLNRRITSSGKRKHYTLSHPKYGRDIRIKINPDTPYHYYDLEVRKRTALSPEESSRPLIAPTIKIEPRRLAKAEARELMKIMVECNAHTSATS